jgi:Arc/MetJ-type ribon-helix-helix transcriptional regulator
MTIHLPEFLESSILKVVQSGQFASLDDAMAEAARLLLQKISQAAAEVSEPFTSETVGAPASKPIWEVAEEIRKRIPAEEWTKLPKDGAEQLDHYLYGSPKRPPAR